MSKSFPPHTIFQWIFPGIFLTTILFGFSNTAFAATRTISNVGGNWDSTGTWVEAAVPTSADDIVATGTSGNVTINVAASARSVNLTGYVGTLTHNSGITLSIGDATAGAGNVALKFVAGMTYTLGSVTTSAINFISTSATQQTITTGGKTLGNWTINGAGSSYLLSDSNTVGSTSTVTLTAGTLNTNGQTCSWGLFNFNNTNVKTITLGNSTINMTGSGEVWKTQNNSSNTTVNANTSTINLTDPSVTFDGGGKIWNNVNFTANTSGSLSWYGGTFNNLSVVGNAVKTASFGLGNTGPWTINTSLTFQGDSSVNRLIVHSGDLGNDWQFQLGASATFRTAGTQNVDFRDIAVTGGASNERDLSAITGLSGNAGGNSGITFTTAATQTYTGGTGNWSDVTKWTSRVPLPQDNVNMSGVTGGTITADMPRLGKSIDWTGASGTPTFAYGTNITNYGSATFISGMTFSGTPLWTFEGRGVFTVTCNGLSFPATTISMVGGTLTPQDAFSSSGNVTLTDGSFLNSGNFNVSIVKFDASSVTRTRRVDFGNAVWTFTGLDSGVKVFAFQSPTGLTFNANSSTVLFSNTSATAKTFAGGGLTYNNLSITGGGSGAVIITGANTFNTVTIGAPKTVTFPSGATQTISSLIAQGSSGNTITLQSSSAGSAATLSDSSGINILGYCSIKDITATGGASFKAYNNCTNVSGNTRWKFKRAPMIVR